MATDADLLSIGEVAERTGLRPSALRYYEDVGLLAPAARIGGRRHYDPAVLRRLAVVALCQDTGFTIGEIRDFLSHGRRGARQRWRRVAERKLGEMDARIEQARATRRLLEDALRCECDDPGTCDLVARAVGRRVSSRAG